MKEADVLPLLYRKGVILDGHFQLRSGLHSGTYVNKDLLYINPNVTRDVCKLIADAVLNRRCELSLFPLTTEVAVVSPAVGGVALSQAVTSHLLDLGVNVVALFADKNPDGSFVLKRGYEKLVCGRKVAVVEDILTTGGAARATVEAVRVAGGDVFMVAALCNRGPSTAETLGVPFLKALVTLSLPNYDPKECPLCASGVPVSNSVGHGAKKA